MQEEEGDNNVGQSEELQKKFEAAQARNAELSEEIELLKSSDLARQEEMQSMGLFLCTTYLCTTYVHTCSPSDLLRDGKPTPCHRYCQRSICFTNLGLKF